MHTMKADDFRSLTPEDLNARIFDMKRQLFNLKMQAQSNQLTNSNEIRNTRRNIARAQTVQREMMAQASKQT